MKQTEILQRDLKKVLQVLPEGVMIYKRFGNPHIKLWNNELERLFKFKPLVQIKKSDDHHHNNQNEENENTRNNMTVTDENTTILQ